MTRRASKTKKANLTVGTTVVESVAKQLAAEAAERELRRRMEEETLRESERRFTEFMRNLPGLAWIKDKHGRYVYANEMAERAFGIPLADLYGKTDEDVFPKETAEQFRKNDLQALASAAGIRTVEQLRQEDGIVHHSIVSKFPIPDADGNPSLIGGVAFDITEQKQAEEAIRELNVILERKVEERTEELRVSLRRLKDVIAHLTIAAIAIDEHDVILEVNRLFCDFFLPKRGPGELIGKRGWEFRDELLAGISEPRTYWEKTRQMLQNRKPVLGQDITLRDGRVLSRDYIPILDGDSYLGMLLLYRDVTQERRIDAAKSEFMSLASHQLRTPLTNVRWLLGRLEKSIGKTMSEQDAALLRQSRNAAARMAETISTMMQISRIQSGDIQISRQEVDCRSLLEEVVHTLRSQIGKPKQAVHIECMPDFRVRTDERLLEEVLCNLVGNALKYTPDDGAVTLRAIENGAGVMLVVQDTGYGIPRNQQAQVFRKFFRGDNIVTLDTDGTGLGLYLSSLIMQLLGGSIDFVSEEGKGTTFTLRIPHA